MLLAYGGVPSATPLDANGGAIATSRTITAPVDHHHGYWRPARGRVRHRQLIGHHRADGDVLSGIPGLVRDQQQGGNPGVRPDLGAAGRRAPASPLRRRRATMWATHWPCVQAAAVDTTPPAVPVGLKATAQPDSVQLTWAGSAEPDLAGYRVYRSSGGGPFTELTASPIGTPSFIDSVSSRLVALSYRVTAVDTSGERLRAAFVSVPAAGSSLDDVSAEAGLAMTTRSWAVSTVDYDNDGDEDVHLALHANAESKLMRNNGDGTFTWVAQGTWSARNTEGKQIDRHACAWADVDGNGLKDVYCTVGRNSMNQVKTALVDNEMWLQLTPGQFADVGTQWGLGDACGRGRYPAFLDVNRDGWRISSSATTRRAR